MHHWAKCFTIVSLFCGPLAAACHAAEKAEDYSMLVKDSAILKAVVTFADNLVEHGRDIYGPKHTPLFVNQLDITTKKIPEKGLHSRDKLRTGASKHCCNLMWDCSLIRLMDGLTRVTGKKKYSRAIDEYLGYLLGEDSVRNKRPNGKRSIPWGDHEGYNVVLDRPTRWRHEVKIGRIPWDRLYAVNPKATVIEIEMLREHIIDTSKSYAFSRHWPHQKNPPDSDCMNSSGGLYIAAWAFLYGKTKQPKYLDWATGMANYLWSCRNKDTNLLAAHPHTKGRMERTEYGGPWRWFAPNLLYAAEEVSPEKGKLFTRQAVAYVRAYVKYGYDPKTGGFFENFRLADGKPIGRAVMDFAGLANKGSKAASLAYCYKRTGVPEFRRMVDRMVPLFTDAERLPKGRPPISAAKMAGYLKCLLAMYEATGEKSYLDRARPLADMAMKYYYVDGFFVCGPPNAANLVDKGCDFWKLYCNRVGSAQLALQLLRYELLRTGHKNFIRDDVMF